MSKHESRSWAFGKLYLIATAPREAIQKTKRPIEQCTRLLGIDLPSPGICDVERAANLGGAAMRHDEEALGIATAAPATLGQVVHDATGGALDLVGGISAVLAK